MRRLKKKVYLGLAYTAIGVLAIVRCANPNVARTSTLNDKHSTPDTINVETINSDAVQSSSVDLALRQPGLHVEHIMPTFKPPDGQPVKNRIYSVPSFRQTFPDLQDVQIEAARQWGVSPVENRQEAEARKDELVYVGSNPYYSMDSRMNHSIPYLVPRASDLLQKISRNFLDSLAIKGIPLHTLIVTSVLRTEEDIRRLRKVNSNASAESCHRFGTTFDICYNRYKTVQHPDGPERRAVRNDSLKWVLSEVLRDVREDGLCYVKYEVRQGCFHITVR